MSITSNVEMIVAVIAVCAVPMTLPYKYWNLRNICGDLGLFACAVMAYFLLSYYSRNKPQKKSCQDSFIDSELKCVSEDAVLEDASNVEDSTIQVVHEVDASVHCDDDSTSQIDEYTAQMEKYAAERNIGATIRTFRLIQKEGGAVSSTYNTVLKAWIKCGNVQAAEDWMENMLEARMADSTSFHIIIKALVLSRAVDKAKDLLEEMKRAGMQPFVATFNEILGGLVREGRFSDSFQLLDDMHAQGVQATGITLNTITKLIDTSRDIGDNCNKIRKILHKYNLYGKDDISSPEPCVDSNFPVPVTFPRLASVMSKAEGDKDTPASHAHEIHLTGNLCQIKAARKTLKQRGFLDKDEETAWPLDGHWETDHGLTVVIEGKIVRWSGQRASRLRFTTEDRSGCQLLLYGEATRGQLVPPTGAPDARKALRWENGDVWHSFEGRVIGQDALYCQSMTKTLRDKSQDAAYTARSKVVLRCVSKQALLLPSILEEAITQFLGNDLYFVRIHFISRWNPEKDDEEDLRFSEADADICDSLSRRHPRIGLRHCWADLKDDRCGQRTFVNGEQVDEGCFSRHVGTVCWA